MKQNRQMNSNITNKHVSAIFLTLWLILCIPSLLFAQKRKLNQTLEHAVAKWGDRQNMHFKAKLTQNGQEHTMTYYRKGSNLYYRIGEMECQLSEDGLLFVFHNYKQIIYSKDTLSDNLRNKMKDIAPDFSFLSKKGAKVNRDQKKEDGTQMYTVSYKDEKLAVTHTIQIIIDAELEEIRGMTTILSAAKGEIQRQSIVFEEFSIEKEIPDSMFSADKFLTAKRDKPLLKGFTLVKQ